MTSMKLYRIRRISDGKYLSGSMMEDKKILERWDGSKFTKTGNFLKQKKTIEKHLYNLSCDWQRVETGPMNWEYQYDRIYGPDWNRLNLYQVECLVVLDSETIKQSAMDFMGVMQNV